MTQTQHTPLPRTTNAAITTLTAGMPGAGRELSPGLALFVQPAAPHDRDNATLDSILNAIEASTLDEVFSLSELQAQLPAELDLAYTYCHTTGKRLGKRDLAGLAAWAAEVSNPFELLPYILQTSVEPWWISVDNKNLDKHYSRDPIGFYVYSVAHYCLSHQPNYNRGKKHWANAIAKLQWLANKIKLHAWLSTLPLEQIRVANKLWVFYHQNVLPADATLPLGTNLLDFTDPLKINDACFSALRRQQYNAEYWHSAAIGHEAKRGSQQFAAMRAPRTETMFTGMLEGVVWEKERKQKSASGLGIVVRTPKKVEILEGVKNVHSKPAGMRLFVAGSKPTTAMGGSEE